MHAESQSREALNNRLSSISWALFLIMIGGLFLVPAGTVPESTWLLGVGIILLGLNAIRFQNKIPMSWSGVVLGTVALIVGIAGFVGFQLQIFPILIIIIGISILIEALSKKK